MHLKPEAVALSAEDLRAEHSTKLKEQRLLAPLMLTEIEKTLAKNEQVIVLVGRRGFAHYLLSPETNKPLLCPECSISLTLHKKKQALHCHYCGFSSPLKQFAGDEKQKFIAVGSGAEKLEAYLQECFPQKKVARLDSELTSSAAKLRACLADFRARKLIFLLVLRCLLRA